MFLSWRSTVYFNNKLGSKAYSILNAVINKSSFQILKNLHFEAAKALLLVFLVALPIQASAATVDMQISSFSDNGFDPSPRGGIISYTISVSNNSANIASNAVLTVPVPASTTFVSVADSVSAGACVNNAGVATCNYPVIAGGSTKTVTLQIRTTGATGITINPTATINVSGTDTDSNPGNNVLSQNTTIDNGADTYVTIAGSPGTVIGGDNVTWAIAGGNNGPDSAVNPTIKLTLPGTLTFVSASGGGFSCSTAGSPVVVTCTQSGLASGASFSGLNLVTKVSGATGGTVSLGAAISSQTSDPETSNNTNSSQVNVSEGADLAISQNAPNPSLGISGGEIIFTANASNLGPSPAAAGLTVTYQLPATFNFNSATPAGAGWAPCTFDNPSHIVTCINSGSYAVGRTSSITISANAPTVVTPTDFNTITATVSPNVGSAPDAVTSNNSASVNLTVTPDGADLEIKKNRTPNPVAQGQQIVSTISVVNHGPRGTLAGTITVVDTIDLTKEAFVSAIGSDWVCGSPVGNQVSCVYNLAVSNGAKTSDLVVRTTAAITGATYTAINNAAVTYSGTPGDWNAANGNISASVVATAAGASVDISLSKTANTTSGNSTLEFDENTLTYNLRLTNKAGNTVNAQDIVLTDVLPGYIAGTVVNVAPPALTNTSGTSTATFTCTTGGTVTCTQDAATILRPGDFVDFVITTGRPLLDGNLANNASAFSSTQGDPDRSDNTPTVPVQIDPIADVEMLNKTLLSSTVLAGTNATYTLTYRNNGPSQATNVHVMDTFVIGAGDSGFTVVSITSSKSGSTCSGLVAGTSYPSGSPALDCNIGTLANGQAEFVRLVIRPNFKAGQTGGTLVTITNDGLISTNTKENSAGTTNNNNLKSATLNVDAASIDLLVNNTDNVDPLAYDPATGGNNANNDISYLVNIVNRGPSLGTGLNFTYTMTPPAGKTARFNGDTSALGGSLATPICNNVGNTVTGPATMTITCTYAGAASNLAADATVNRYLVFRMLTAPNVGGDTYATNATVHVNETDFNAANDSEGETTSVRVRSELVSLAGNVFVDNNNNSVFNNGEPGIGGVRISLAGNTADGTPICTATATCFTFTAADGSWQFPTLPTSDAAGYTVIETQPLGYTDGGEQLGSQNELGGHTNDRFRVDLSVANTNATGYNFGEITTLANSARLGGRVWVDLNHNRKFDGPDVTTLGSITSVGWTVDLVNGSGVIVASQVTNEFGQYQFEGIPPGTGYQVMFRHPQTDSLFGRAVPNETGATYASGVESSGNPAGADTSRGLLTGLTLNAGDDIVQQSLPLDPSGVVYDALTRALVPGANVTLLGPGGTPVPAANLLSGQSTVTTGNDGLYQFVLIGAFPAGVYTLTIVPPANYVQGPSAIIPPCTATLAVGAAPDPALVQDSIAPPTLAEPIHNPATCSLAAGNLTTTQYFFRFDLTPGVSSDVLNNNIPIDPILAGAISVTKTTPLLNVVRGDLVPYTITARSSQTVLGINIVDRLPPGFKYRSGSASRDGVIIEPVLTGRDLTFPAQNFNAGQVSVYKLILVVGTGVGEGEYINQAWALNSLAGTLVSNVANASVRITPDPTFDCSDIIGKVFDDRNANGYQDEGEPGIPNVRVVTVRGLLITSDAEGRFHVTCADVPDSDHGANFVMKLDERTLPSGYRMTTENPRDVRVTRGKMVKLNFGATVHRVIRLDLNDAAFASDQANLLPEWLEALPKLRERLSERPSILRLAYDPGGGDKKLAQQRLDTVADAMRKLWKQAEKDNNNAPAYPLVIEKALEGQP